jgi:hypothetical protein
MSCVSPEVSLCPLCGRPVPFDARGSWHHPVPRLKGGGNGPVALLHQICHNAVRAALSEEDLAGNLPGLGGALRRDR